MSVCSGIVLKLCFCAVCVDHFRTQNKSGASASRLVAKQGEEKMTEKDINTFRGLTRKVYVEQVRCFVLCVCFLFLMLFCVIAKAD